MRVSHTAVCAATLGTGRVEQAADDQNYTYKGVRTCATRLNKIKYVQQL